MKIPVQNSDLNLFPLVPIYIFSEEHIAFLSQYLLPFWKHYRGPLLVQIGEILQIITSITEEKLLENYLFIYSDRPMYFSCKFEF